MSDLAKRLLDWCDNEPESRPPYDDIRHAAALVETRWELRTEAEAAERDGWRRDIDKATSRADAAEARAERYRKALESIAANSCCDKCQEAAAVARAALRGEG